MKFRILVSLCTAVATASTLWLLAGCGLVETGAVAGTQAASAPEQAKQAKEVQQKIEADLAAAQTANTDAVAAAEAASQ